MTKMAIIKIKNVIFDGVIFRIILKYMHGPYDMVIIMWSIIYGPHNMVHIHAVSKNLAKNTIICISLN